jgi:hypothetical protein
MPHRPVVSLAALAVVAVSAGCTTPRFTHRCDVPQPVVEAAPGPRIPLAVAVRHSAVPGAPADRTERKDEVHTWGVAPALPSRALFERLASSAFDRAVLEPEGAATGAPPAGADAALDVRLGDVRFDWTPVGIGPYFARATYHVALRGTDGAPVTEFDVQGVGSRAPVYLALTHCAGIGDAVALAMQDAGAKVLARLSGDPALAAWLRTRGAAAPALAVRPAADYPAPPPQPEGLAPSAALADAGPPPLPPPRPVTAPAPTGPAVRRSAYASGAIGGFAPEETAGKLEGPGTGWSLFIEAEARFNRYLALATEGGWLYRSYSTAQVAPGMKRGMELETWSLGLGPRVFLPAEIIEPWIGAMPCVLMTRATESFSMRMSMNDWAPAWSTGLLLGAGLRLYPSGRFALGLEVRRLLANTALGSYPGAVGIGGWTLGVSFGAAVPP